MKVTLPISGVEVECKKWLTQEETEANEAELRKYYSQRNDPTITDKRIIGDVLIEAEHNVIESVVVSISGETEEIHKKLMELPAADYLTLKKKIDQEVQPPKELRQT